jgi:hypothetical protein
MGQFIDMTFCVFNIPPDIIQNEACEYDQQYDFPIINLRRRGQRDEIIDQRHVQDNHYCQYGLQGDKIPGKWKIRNSSYCKEINYKNHSQEIGKLQLAHVRGRNPSDPDPSRRK